MMETTLDQASTATGADLEFLVNTPFLRNIPDAAKARLLLAMKPLRVPGGKRFIHQGEEGSDLYIIHKGRCVVVVEKNGDEHPIKVLGPGEVVGEMAVLTGDTRQAHVEAGTDATLWRLHRGDFEYVRDEFPEIGTFLTELVTNRLSNAPLIADRTVGKYVINDILGRGSWSIVYRGAHSHLQMPVAIKMLKHTMAMNSTFLERFQQEAVTIANLSHDHIVRVFDVEKRYRTVFLIMELLEGTSLESLLGNGRPLPTNVYLPIIDQMCSALAYAHEREIVHRDVKPANIFLQRDAGVKILDFGLACTPGTSRVGFYGTPRYAAPEQISEEPVDARSDVYSLGLTIFRMVTGREAFVEQDLTTMLLRQLYDEVPDPSLLVEGLPDEVTRVILTSTRKEADQRYQHVQEIVNELKPLGARLG